MNTITTTAHLLELPANTVVVDRIGVAWQVIQLGHDWSYMKSEKDTRRNGFVQTGNHVHFEAAALESVLPMRVVDDGSPVQPSTENERTEKFVMSSGEMAALR